MSWIAASLAAVVLPSVTEFTIRLLLVTMDELKPSDAWRKVDDVLPVSFPNLTRLSVAFGFSNAGEWPCAIGQRVGETVLLAAKPRLQACLPKTSRGVTLNVLNQIWVPWWD